MRASTTIKFFKLYSDMEVRYFLCLLLIILKTNASKSKFEKDVNILGEELTSYARNTLGTSYLQERYDKLDIEKKSINGITILNKFVDVFKKKVDIASDTLKDLKTFIETDYNVNYPKTRPQVDCCGYSKNLVLTNYFNAKVNRNDFCEVVHLPHTYCPESERATVTSTHMLNSNNALNVLKTAYGKSTGNVYYIYFGSDTGYYIQYPAQNYATKDSKCNCSKFDNRYRPWFVETVAPQQGKDVYIAIDFSNTMIQNGLGQTMKKVVKTLLETVDIKDRIVLALYRGGARDATFTCAKEFTQASPAVIDALKDFVDKATYSGDLKYKPIIDESFSLHNNQLTRKKVTYIITSGNHAEKETQVSKLMKDKSKEVKCSVILNIIFIDGGSTRIEQHENYLKDVCQCSPQCTAEVKQKNKLFKVTTNSNTEDIRASVGQVYQSFAEYRDNIHFTMPYIDHGGLGTLIDACISCFKTVNGIKTFIGVTCLSYLRELLFGAQPEVILQNEDSYTFLIDSFGTTYIHPKFAEPVLQHDRAFPLKITIFETSESFKHIYNSMRGNGTSGVSGPVLVNVSISRGSVGAKFELKNYTYYWKKVPDTKFIIAVVLSNDFNDLHLKNIPPTNRRSPEVYHRLDKYVKYNNISTLCTMIGVVATKETSVVKFSNEVFAEPSTYFEKEDLKTVLQMMENLQGNSTISPVLLFQDTNIQYKLRESAIVTAGLDEVWKNDTDNSNNAKLYTIWRYVGTEAGLMRTYPGHILHPLYDPRVRPWYIQAKSLPEKLTLSTPYTDSGTGTPVITLCKPIFYSSTNKKKMVAAVMGLDFTMQYLNSLIIKLVPDCNTLTSRSKCLLIDRMGYIIYHPDFVNTKTPLLTTHLIEKEPLTAQHLIKTGKMKKNHCIGYYKPKSNSAANKVPVAHIQWFYTLDHLTESISVTEPTCPFYTIMPLNGTNMFVIKVKTDCTGTAKKTDCTILPKGNKRCEPGSILSISNKCEDPCYDKKICLDELPKPLDSSLICQPPDKRLKIVVTYTKDWINGEKKLKLDSCQDPQCNSSSTNADCFRLGCEWCFEYRNKTPLPDELKFCGYKDQCFQNLTKPIYKPMKQPPESDNITVIVICVIAAVIVLVIVAFGIFKYKKRKEISSLPTRPEFGAKNGPAVIKYDNDSGWL